MSRVSTSNLMTFVLVCFFLSGLTSLIYEILWTRMIVKIIGGAPFAVSIILTLFMGGLGLGSYLAGRIVDRIKEPIRLVRIYGILELAIGGYALAFPFLLSALRPIYAVFYNGLFTHFTLYNFLTFIGCAVLLCIPVICMGATLPLLCRFYVTRLSHLGGHAGRLYGLNTIGAAVGALLCGFWLINLLGLWGTLTFAVLINGIIGLFCILAARKIQIRRIAEDEVVPSPGGSDRDDITEGTKLPEYSGLATGALVVFAVSGFCAMAYEVIWARLLGLIVGPTTYSFTIVLVTFILGLALGSMIFGWLADKTNKVPHLLIVTQIVAALSVLGISQFLGNSQLFFAKVIFHFKDQFALLNLVKATILFALIILPTLCLGAAFPLVGKLYTQSLSKVGRSIGVAYAINTIGAVLGAFCAGFVLIPLVGKENGLSLVIALQLVTPLLVSVILILKSRKGVLRFVPFAAAALAGLFLCLHFPAWDHYLLSKSKYHRFGEIKVDIKTTGWLEALFHGPEILTRSEQGELVYYGEGIGGFTTVLKQPDPLGNTQYFMANSGKPDASSHVDMETQTLLAHFPMLFHQDPRTVMVLGLASGITAGEVLYYPVEQLDVIDINEQVVKASQFFVPWNNSVLSNPRTNLIIQDARAHLNLTVQKYDVIISEPSNPWMAGLAVLFTRDFFAMTADRLNEDGVFVQFIHAYEMDWPTFALVGRTFAQVFPKSLLVATRHSNIAADYLLVGFKGRDGLSIDNARQKLSYAQRSKNISLSNPKLLYRLIVSEDLQRLFGPGPVNTDRNPYLEFAAPKLIFYDDTEITRIIQTKKWLSDGTREIIQQVTTDVDSQIDFAAYALSVHEPFSKMVDLSRATPLQKRRFYRLLETYCSNNALDASVFKDDDLMRRCRLAQIEAIENEIDRLPDPAISYAYLGQLYYAEGTLNKAIDSFSRSLQIKPENAAAHNYLGAALAQVGRLDKAITHFKKALQITPNFAEASQNLGFALAQKSNVKETNRHLFKPLQLRPDVADEHLSQGRSLFSQGKFEEAIKSYYNAVQLAPRNADAHNELGFLLARQGRLEEATEHLEQAMKINPELADAHVNMGRILLLKGRFEEAIAHLTEALQIRPDLADVQALLGGALVHQGKFNEAVWHLKKALQIEPDQVEPMNNLAWILATNKEGRIREPDEAIRLAEQACKLTKHKRPDFLDTLAVAYASAGRFTEAMGTAEEAKALAESLGQKRLAEEIGRRLLLFKAGQPYMESPS